MSVSILKTLRHAAVAMAAVLACAGAQAAGQAGDYVFSLSRQAEPGGSFTLSWSDAGIDPLAGFDETTVVLAFDPAVFSYVGAAAGSAFGSGAAFAAPQAVLVDFGGGMVLDGLQFAVSGNGSATGAGNLDVFHVELKVGAAAAIGASTVWLLNPYEGTPIGGSYYDFASQGVSVAVVPEPATVASMLAGLALLAGMGARRRAARQPSA